MISRWHAPLIDAIYEAAAVPSLWPSVLAQLAEGCGAAGGLFFLSSPERLSWVASPKAEWIIEDYIAGGWMSENVRGAPLIAELHPGFRTDSDYRSPGERAALPVYRDFLIPKGIDAAAGSVFQGANNDAIVLTIEHFPSHEAAQASIPMLDRIRPHLGRALSLTSQLSSLEASNTVAALALANVAAAVVSADGRFRAANDRFEDRIGDRMADFRSGTRFCDPFLQSQFVEALAALKSAGCARSIAVPGSLNKSALALHLIPLKRTARDVFGWDGVLILLAEPANASIPSADLLRLLFDLTPSEARVARLVASGRTVIDTAHALGIQQSTVRAQLKRIFVKVGGNRQADLVRLFSGLGAPPDG